MTSSNRIADRDRFDWLLAAAVVAMVATFARVIYFTPIEARQGAAQKIFYVHAPSAFIGLYVGFGLVALAGGLYLWLRDERLDRIAASSAEVGVVFTTVVLLTGPMWGKPIWGTWWTWDARLTSTAILLLVYVGYLMLRGLVDDAEARGRYAAVVGILGAVNIPIVHFSVKWWRALHQPSTILGPGPSPIDPAIGLALLVNWIAFTLLFAYFLARRIEIARLEET